MPTDSGTRSIRHYGEQPRDTEREPWLVLAAQPLLPRKTFNRFSQAAEAVAEHHTRFRDAFCSAETQCVSSVNGTIVLIMPVGDISKVVGSAWRHVSSGESAPGPGLSVKAAVTIGDVVRLSAADAPLEPYGEAIEECVRLLRDVAEPGQLVITKPVYSELSIRNQGQFDAGGQTLTIIPEEPVPKRLLPAVDLATGVALVSNTQSDEDGSPVLIVFRPDVRVFLAALDEALREIQSRFEQVLPPIRGTLRDPSGGTGSETHFADHLVALKSLVEGKTAPIVRLQELWDQAEPELGRHQGLKRSVKRVSATAKDVTKKLARLDKEHAKGLTGSSAYQTHQGALESLLPKLKATPSEALEACAEVRARHEEQLDADG